MSRNNKCRSTIAECRLALVNADWRLANWRLPSEDWRLAIEEWRLTSGGETGDGLPFTTRQSPLPIGTLRSLLDNGSACQQPHHEPDLARRDEPALQSRVALTPADQID